MKLRQKNKRDQALDAVASVAKTWSEWHLGKRATTTVAKGAKKASKVKDSGKATRLKIAGAVALVGGLGAAVAKKVMGGGQAEPLGEPPGPAPDMPTPPPSPVVVEDRADDTAAKPETGTGEHPSTDVEELPPPKTPIVVEDLTDAAPDGSAASDDPDDAVEPDASADDAEVAATADKPVDKAS
ncbi:MAG: hypothetical protein QOH83_2403 [Solirubrobacteraceae bacterium]|jgi:hypothetical protein|nr:hypothetical protein [Solirubrobacteraceae bacterium]